MIITIDSSGNGPSKVDVENPSPEMIILLSVMHEKGLISFVQHRVKGDTPLTHDILINNGFNYSEKEERYYLDDYSISRYDVPYTTVEAVENTLNNYNPKGKPNPPIKLKMPS